MTTNTNQQRVDNRMSKNPYAFLRELCGLTQREFELRNALSHTTLTSIEAGFFPDLSDYMVEALGRVCHEKGISAADHLLENYGTPTLQTAYHVWQIAHRRAAKSTLHSVAPVPSTDAGAGRSPFDVWSQQIGGSRRGFCSLLCLPTATVMRYAEGATRSMPEALRMAFRDAGLSEVRIAELDRLQSDWVARVS